MSELKFLPYCNLYSKRIGLILSLPEGHDEDNRFYCNDEWDFDVPDAEICIDAEKLMNALIAYDVCRDTFFSVRIDISIYSEGYQGKLRGEMLEIVAAPYTRGFWTNARFYNDWSGSDYFFDTDSYWPVPTAQLAGYLCFLIQ